MFRSGDSSERRLPACVYCLTNLEMIHKQIKKAKQIDPDTGWHSRGYLPHFDDSEVIQFITFRLANSLPRDFLRRLKSKLDSKQITDIEYHHAIESCLDRLHGPDHLKNELIAAIVEDNLLYLDGQKYKLLHWVIMPNHVHLLLKAMVGITLASIMHSMKSYTANRANKVLETSGRFWSVEYFDRYIRNADHYSKAVAYIHANPVKAGLCEASVDWVFGCARRHE
jgi:REP element-mobilizing transposase RayT